MKKLKAFSTVSILVAIALVSCNTTVSSVSPSSSEEPSSVSSVATSSGKEDSSNTASSSVEQSSVASSSSQSSKASSSSAVSSSSVSSSVTSSSAHSSAPISSSVPASSSSQAPSSTSSSQAPSSSSTPSSSSSTSSSQAPSSSSVPSSSSSTSSSQAPSSSSTPSSQPSSSSSVPSSSTPTPVDPLADYTPINTFSKRMPGEFEPAQMIKMCYPINMPLNVYKTIAQDNKVLLLVNPDGANKSRITKARNEFVNGGVNVDNVTFIDMDIDGDYGYWVRDFSPFYVFNDKQLTITDFTYNRPRYEQNAVPSKLATYFNIPYSKMDLTHTGGNLMQDGRGTAFSDDLVYQENSSRNKVHNQMRTYTGTDNYVVTIDPQGDYIAHIDCWGKIVAPDKIIVAKLPQNNSRYQYYEQVANQLANTKCAYGYNYRIYRVEEPGGNTVAPYTNSLIANGHVYMPLGSNSTYNQKALEVYREALPGYDVVGLQGFSSSDPYDREFLNTDALHCRTHEVPDQNMVFIDSREVYHGEVALKDNYLIKANIVSYADEDLSNVNIHYSINGGDYVTEAMDKYLETTNYTYVFSDLVKGDEVSYYIDAKDNKNNYNIDPTCGQLDPHHFVIA